MTFDCYIDSYSVNLLPYIMVSSEEGQIEVIAGWLCFCIYRTVLNDEEESAAGNKASRRQACSQ